MRIELPVEQGIGAFREFQFASGGIKEAFPALGVVLETEGELVGRWRQSKVAEKVVGVVGIIVNKHLGFGVGEQGGGRILE